MSLCHPEILAPAGSFDALTAAVRSGADAVYLGADRFNARQGAANFSGDELSRAVAYCHGRGVKVHLTLNTLVREDEMDEALSVAAHACACGVDALIVQDRGLARRIRAAAPTMPLHASTQLSCHTPAGVAALREAGFSRVVLAREMSEGEIAACRDGGCELEVFVHGALCMCVSGQCYLSALWGGRSGNRGRCAQPCRLPFSARPGVAGPKDAALSLRDLTLIPHMARLQALGVASLKIEGRLKRPEYVAGAVAACRRARDGEAPDPALWQDLGAVFSRSGFTDGYFTAQRGTAMFGRRRPEDAAGASQAQSRLRDLYRREFSHVPVSMTLTVPSTGPCRLTVSDGLHRIEVAGEAGQPPQQQPLTEETARQHLQKTGGTPFRLQTLTLQNPARLTLPAGAQSRLRRDALDRLLAAREQAVPVPFTATAVPSYPAPAPAGPIPRRAEGALPFRVARVAQIAQIPPGGDGASLWLIPALADPAGPLPAVPFGVEIPRGLFGREPALRDRLRRWKARGALAALCGNVGAAALATEAGLPAIGGFGLNLMNRDALLSYTAAGLSAATLSFELTFSQMAFAQNAPLPCGLFVYGRQPLMLTRNCPRRCAGGDCTACRTREGGLWDRQGRRFPLACDGGCTELLNSVVLDVTGRSVPPVDFWLFHFTDESPEQVARVLARPAGGPDGSDGETTAGLYRRGVQ